MKLNGEEGGVLVSLQPTLIPPRSCVVLCGVAAREGEQLDTHGVALGRSREGEGRSTAPLGLQDPHNFVSEPLW